MVKTLPRLMKMKKTKVEEPTWIMDLPDLATPQFNCFNCCNRKFSLKTTLLLAEQMVYILSIYFYI